MGLFVSTTGTNVVIPELGITITHPTTDYNIGTQFSSEYIQRASTLTSVIRAGTLVWRKTAGGTAQPATDYDADYLEVDEENTGLGLKADRAVTFKDLTAGSLASKSGFVTSSSFTGNPKKYAVVFGAPMASAAYSINIAGVDSRAWSWESKLTTGFTINTNANQALTGNVDWDIVANGETV